MVLIIIKCCPEVPIGETPASRHRVGSHSPATWAVLISRSIHFSEYSIPVMAVPNYHKSVNNTDFLSLSLL